MSDPSRREPGPEPVDPTAVTLAGDVDLGGARAEAETIAMATGPVVPPEPTLAGDWGESPARPAQPSSRPAPAVPGYEILGELGRGGMGVVYKARQVRLNRPCAPEDDPGRGARRAPRRPCRFLAEAEAVARLQHPNIVQIYDVGEADGLPFFELEYVEGGSLDRRARRHPLAAARAAAALVETLARGDRRGAPAGDRPPRPEAGQHPARRPTARPRSPTSAWPRSLDVRRGPDADRVDPGHAQLHGPRAGRGARPARSARRPTSTRWGRSSTSC